MTRLRAAVGIAALLAGVVVLTSDRLAGTVVLRAAEGLG